MQVRKPSRHDIWAHGLSLRLVLTCVLLAGFTPIMLASKPTDRITAFQTPDFAWLETEAFRRHPGVTPSELSPRVKRNFEYLYRNQLRSERFFRKPRREKVLGRMVAILRYQNELNDALAEARHLLTQTPVNRGSRDVSHWLSIIRRVRRLSETIGDEFGKYFLDLRNGPYSFRIAGVESRSQFLSYVLEAERINRRLASSLNHYFFGDSPGTVKVGSYQHSSVRVLTESMKELSDLTERRLLGKID